MQRSGIPPLYNIQAYCLLYRFNTALFMEVFLRYSSGWTYTPDCGTCDVAPHHPGFSHSRGRFGFFYSLACWGISFRFFGAKLFSLIRLDVRFTLISWYIYPPPFPFSLSTPCIMDVGLLETGGTSIPAIFSTFSPHREVIEAFFLFFIQVHPYLPSFRSPLFPRMLRAGFIRGRGFRCCLSSIHSEDPYSLFLFIAISPFLLLSSHKVLKLFIFDPTGGEIFSRNLFLVLLNPPSGTYLLLRAFFSDRDLPVFTHWFRIQLCLGALRSPTLFFPSWQPTCSVFLRSIRRFFLVLSSCFLPTL